MDIIIINGPNLNLLGKREPDLYGNTSFSEYLQKLTAKYPYISFQYYQSNVEGEIINYIQEHGFNDSHIILNAGGYTHTSVAIADAVAAITSPVIEVHITNIYAREKERQTSLLSKNCEGVISGLGIEVYELAIIHFTGQLKNS